MEEDNNNLDQKDLKDLSNSMDDFVKALKSAPDDSWWITKKYYNFKYWFEDKIYYSYFPDWARYGWNKYKNFWYEQISSRLNHRNKWAIPPRTFCDFDYLITEFCYKFIISYVEEQKCFETIVIEEPNHSKIKEIYEFAKTGRNKLLKERDAAYPPLSDDWIEKLGSGEGLVYKEKKSYEELYGEVDRLEKILKDKDDEYIFWLVSHRNSLWT